MTNWQKTLDRNILNWRDVTAAELPEHLFKWLEKTCWEQRNKKLDILKIIHYAVILYSIDETN